MKLKNVFLKLFTGVAVAVFSLTAAYIDGTVTDSESGDPVEGAEVVIDRGFWGGTSSNTQTDSSGFYSFDGLEAFANYSLTITKSGYNDTTVNSVNLSTQDTLTVDVAMVHAQPGSSLVSGTVTDIETGDSIADVRVILRERTGFNSGGSFTWNHIDTVTSGENGNYSFTEVSASSETEPYSVLFNHSQYASATSNAFQIAEGETLTVDMALTPLMTGNLYVSVKIEADSSEIFGASVAAQLQSTNDTLYKGKTDSAGWAGFSDVVSGSYAVTVTTAGYLTETKSTTVDEAEDDTVNVWMTPDSQETASKYVLGTVTDTSENPVPDADIILEVLSRQSTMSFYTSTDSLGQYTISGIPDQYTAGEINVQASGYQERDTLISLESDTVTTDIALIPEGVFVTSDGPVNNKAERLICRLAGKTYGNILLMENVSAGAEISLYTLNGCRILEKNIVKQGSAAIKLPVNLASQMLLVKIESDGISLWKRIIVK